MVLLRLQDKLKLETRPWEPDETTEHGQNELLRLRVKLLIQQHIVVGDRLGDLEKERFFLGGVFWRCGMGNLLFQYYHVEKVAMINKKI